MAPEPRTLLRGVRRINTATESIGFMRLDKNERTLPFPEWFVEKTRRALTGDVMMAYPTNAEELCRRLAAWLGVRRSEVLISAGSDMGLKAIFQTYVDAGDEVVFHKPCWAMYPVYADMSGAVRREVPVRSDFALDVDAMKAAVTDRTRMVIVENPNGYVGTAVALDGVLEIVEHARAHGAVAIVDEAYFHFCRDSVIGRIHDFDNLIVSRTFSKALGVAGARLGYLVSNETNIENVGKVKGIFEVSSASVEIAKLVLAHPEVAAEYVALVDEMRPYFQERLRTLGIASSTTQTNFLLVKIPDHIDLGVMIDELKTNRILVRRPFEEGALRNWMRVGIGTREEVDLFVDTLQHVMTTATV